METDVYKMKLHEQADIVIDGISWVVVRVPGGWIYDALSKPVFVPFVFDSKAFGIAVDDESPAVKIANDFMEVDSENH